MNFPGSSGNSGQILLLATFIILILLLSIPLIIFVNKTHGLHQVGSSKRTQGLAIAQEGISFAMQLLSSSTTTWKQAMDGSQFPSDCNSDNEIPSASGGFFRITCDKTQTQPYQVRVMATAWVRSEVNGQRTPLRSMEAFVSQKTLSATLPGLNAPVALQVFSAPVITNPGASTMSVYFGPILSYDAANPWVLSGPMDQYRFPRKFAVGGIQGTSYSRSPTSLPPTHDGKEYWSYISPGFYAVIDTMTYLTLAKDTRPPSPPVNYAGTAWTATPAGSGYFFTGNGTAIFDSPGVNNPPDAGYSFSSSTSVLFIDGDALFRHVTLDLQPYGAVIVTGNLTLEENRDQSDGYTVSVSVPPTAAREDPYQTSCGAGCVVTNHWIEYRGFLYVQGNLTVNVGAGPCSNSYAGGCNWWALAGVVRVDGSFVIQNGNFQLQYNDAVNRNILVRNLQLQLDALQDIAHP